ncbi:MAG: hypothetical protein V1857_06315 [archaeon]
MPDDAEFCPKCGTKKEHRCRHRFAARALTISL